LLYTVKPQLYDDSGNPISNTYQREDWNSTSGEAFSDGFHEWSYVWLPDIVHYGLDSNYSRVITTNVPQAPGCLALSHWSDGNPKFSLGPPTENSTVTISFLWAVYNNSSVSSLVCSKTTSPCTITNGVFQSGINSSPLPTGSVSVNPGVRSIGASLGVSSGASSWLLVFVMLLWFRSFRD